MGRTKPKKSEEKGQRLNSPNDLIFARDGGLFFTDPTYGLQGTRKEERELSYQGVYYVGVVEEGGSGDDEDGEQEENPTKYEDTPTLLIRGLASPNGLALSPDEKILYVVESTPPRVWKYDVLSMPRGERRRRRRSDDADMEGSEGGMKMEKQRRKKKKKKRTQSLDELLSDLEEEEEEEGESSKKGVKDGVEDGVEETKKNKEETEKEKQEDVVPVLSEGSIFFDFQPLVDACSKKLGSESDGKKFNNPDGMKIDVLGNLYVAGACGVHVIGTDGLLTASLLADVTVSNVAWGGDERMYVTTAESELLFFSIIVLATTMHIMHTTIVTCIYYKIYFYNYQSYISTFSWTLFLFCLQGLLRFDVSRHVIPTLPDMMTGINSNGEEDSGGMLSSFGL